MLHEAFTEGRKLGGEVSIPTMDFVKFPKIARLNREAVVTEQIDGTNAQIYIPEDGLTIFAGSRSKWITPEDDNFGFAKWVQENKEELLKLGPGSHFGEWWGAGIQRRYGLGNKRFSLFNTSRWNRLNTPICCNIVPVLWSGLFCDLTTDSILELLAATGSVAAPGFMKPEGIVIYHAASSQMFKRTIEKDAEYKSGG